MQATTDNKIKNFGAVYTPLFIVNIMLDSINYQGEYILEKHILENSFGDGAFLKEIVVRYCEAFIKVYGNNNSSLLKKHLETYIHGIELDREEYNKCINSLNEIVARYNIYNVDWSMYCSSSLSFNKFNGLMDYVIGNPPYVRVHNLQDLSIKNLDFTKTGMTDLYLAFFEIGFKQLNENGVLCYITPSSFFSSKSGEFLRNYIKNKHNLQTIIDLGRIKVFENIMSYTAISIFHNNKSFDSINYVEYDTNKKLQLPYSKVFQNGAMIFDEIDNLNTISSINNNYDNVFDNSIIVKNGYATLADKIFINNNINNENIIIPILKASTGKWNKVIFPYNKNGIPYSEEYIAEYFPHTYKYLYNHKNKLSSRSLEKNGVWYLFGRSQGIKDTFKNKIAINTMIKDLNSIKVNEVKAGSGIYSGLYILTTYDFDSIYSAIYNDDFILYLKSLKKYKSGGYYTFSSKDLEKYLYYKICKMDKDIL